jgi:subtilase family serine protease
MAGFRFAALLVAVSLVGCVEDDDSTDVPQMPHVPVCAGGALRCFAHAQLDEATAQIRAFATPQGFGPADLISAYKIETSLHTVGTIAVVEAYNYPAAETDLAHYRAHFGLPPCTSATGCFRKVNQSGGPSPLPGVAPAFDDWTVEAALDLDMASAACPTCKLVLVEADDDVGNGLFLANDGAASLAPTVISNSWGGPEQGSELGLEPHFNHPGIGIFVASGDAGYDEGGAGPSYPSTSAHVTAVGGTTLTRAPTVRGWSEKAWLDGGSSCSKTIPKPTFQTSTACSKRMASDVAAVGDPSTGVAVYNAANGGWVVIGGTSAAAPFVAGVYALYGLGNRRPAFAYANHGAFFDVTTGHNGSCASALCRAGIGWDGPTGVGTPNGAKL